MYTIKETKKINCEITNQFIKILNFISKKKDYNEYVYLFFEKPNMNNYFNIINFMNKEIYKLIFLTNIFEIIYCYKTEFTINIFITNNKSIPIDIFSLEISKNKFLMVLDKSNISIQINLQNYLNNVKFVNENINNLIQNNIDNKVKLWRIIYLENGTSISNKYTNSTLGLTVNNNNNNINQESINNVN